MNPKISIIVPVYNVEKYLNRCVDSILAQTFTNFELILVDDGSPDNSGKICDEYAEKDSRIKVFHKANGGVSSARNLGLDNAKGEYIMFCDSDDAVSPYWCECLYEAVKEYPDFLCNHDLIKGDSYSKIHWNGKPSPSLYSEISYAKLYNLGLSGYSFNKIYKKDIISDNKIRFNENYALAEDVDFAVRYCKYCSGILFINAPLYFYYTNLDGAMHSYRPNLLENRLRAFYCRVPLIGNDDMTEYCDGNLCVFIHLLENVFDKRNKQGFIKKIRYNQKMLKTEEFGFCLEHASGNRESAAVMKLLKSRSYYLYWFFMKLVKLKNKFKR